VDAVNPSKHQGQGQGKLFLIDATKISIVTTISLPIPFKM